MTFSNSDFFVHYYSGHHHSMKMNIFLGVFLRALKIVSPMNIDDEFATIFEISGEQKYPAYRLIV